MSRVIAIVRRDFHARARYPLSTANSVLLTPLYEMAIPSLLLGRSFLVHGSAEGLARRVGTTDMVGWLVVGVVAASLLVGTMWTVSHSFQAERSTGVLEQAWASPVPRTAFVAGEVLSNTLLTLTAGLIIVAFAIGFLGAHYRAAGLIAAVPVLVVMVIGNLGFGYLTGALVLLMRRPDELIEPLAGVIAVFTGVVFPVTILPAALRGPTYLLPGTWTLDLFRYFALGTHPIKAIPVEMALAVATALAWFLAGRRVFRLTDRRICRSGALTQY